MEKGKVEILIFEACVVSAFLIFGLSGKKIFGIQGPRSATIILGIIGILLCMRSVGKFISGAPFRPETIVAYLFGSLAMLSFLTQLFQWKIPVLKESGSALTVLSMSMYAKILISFFFSGSL